MKLNIPETLSIICPDCSNHGHYTNETEMTTCSNCGLKLHKSELIQHNEPHLKEQTDKILKDLAKQIKKGFKF